MSDKEYQTSPLAASARRPKPTALSDYEQQHLKLLEKIAGHLDMMSAHMFDIAARLKSPPGVVKATRV